MNCEQLNTLFIEAQQQVTNDLISRKWNPTNGYYGKTNDGGRFPLNSGTTIKGYELGRVTIPQGQGWRPVEDALCATNACDFDPEVMHSGSDEYQFSLIATDVRTDWVCLASLALRAMPGKEIAKLEDGMRAANQRIQDELRRSRYLMLGLHKIVNTVDAVTVDLPGGGTVDLPAEDYQSCTDNSLDNAYVFEQRANGEMDENHVRVCVLPSKISYISEMTPDMADSAKRLLQYDASEGAATVAKVLYDLLLPDGKISGRMAKMENAEMDNAATYGGYNMLDLRQGWGIERVIRDYATRQDVYGMRFFPDTATNAGLDDESFDLNDPSTWPRFNRVHPYKYVKALIGVKAVPDPDYDKAPFGISTILNPRVMEVMSFPNTMSVGSGKVVGGYGFDGTANWVNPDWECNLTREKGFWMMRFRAAIRPDYANEGFSWFHRLNHRMALRGNQCAIPTRVVPDDVTPYCYEGLGGSVNSGNGSNVVQP